MVQTVQVVTANRLGNGEVVYLAADLTWTARLDAAARLDSKTLAEERLAVAKAAVEARVVVSPYLIELAETPQGFAPVRQREIIRAAGPTVRRDLGKQAEGQAR